jgi:hypothetical protein
MRIAILAVVLVAGIVFFRYRATMAETVESPVSGSAAVMLSAQELRKLKDLGAKGNCEAAHRVSRYYSYVLNDFDQTLPWLRIAASCPNANAKAELIYQLLSPIDKGESDKEIDQLVLELEKIDPGQAQAARTEIETTRAKRAKGKSVDEVSGHR